MICRMWTGMTHTDDADAYQQYMREVAPSGYADVPGNRAVLMLRRPCEEGRTEFTMVTVWDRLDNVIAFAGQDPERAVFYPRDDEFLVQRDLYARHYNLYGGYGLKRRSQAELL
jgi:heme-degrading monooxygenase HmoA